MKIKLLYISILLTFFSYSITAQSVILTPSDSLYSTNTVNSLGDDVSLTAFVENTSNDSLYFTWRILSVSSNTPTSWEMTLCDNTQCPLILENQVENFSLLADSTSILKFGILPYLESGESEISVRVFASGTSFDTVISYKMEIIAEEPTSIKDFDNNTLSIYPNPATNFIQIEGVEDINTIDNIDIYSIIGKKILSTSISSKADLKLNIQNLDNGVYLVKLFNDQKNVFYTKTFVKK